MSFWHPKTVARLRAILVWGALAWLPGAAAAQIGCGDTLGPGGKFTLERDLVCSGSSPLTLVGPVSLDLGGRRVECGGSVTGIQVEGRGARLGGGEITDCRDGVVLAGAGKHRVEDLVVTAVFNGLRFESPGNRVRNVSVHRASQNGFDVRSDGQRIEYSSAIETGGRGFKVDSSGNRIEHSVAETTGGVGFQVRGDRNRLEELVANFGDSNGIDVEGAGNRVRDCVAHRNDSFGLRVEGGGNQFQRNRSHGNGGPGALVEGNGNQFVDNHVYGGNDEGLVVDGIDNRIHGNTAIGNTLDVETADCDNSWKKNRFGTRNRGCIDSGLCVGCAPGVELPSPQPPVVGP